MMVEDPSDTKPCVTIPENEKVS